ncbi:hypothetical protein SAMN05414137_109325 [Streptacidiphilus jiangxiensis]|uniref:Uncharacterized protein n=2 Tax=Streptacidiphilus jiangxiensis TaxID=235985 RepID=A0A1H7R1R3_STRJI|nr:hypothetical protein SAMN05414137_109325 [Streptacidiphilus jiangxiensis]
MATESGDLPEDPDELYRLLMRGASTVWQVEAAERLIFQVGTLRQWLVGNGFIRLEGDRPRPWASTHFDEALAKVLELSRDGRAFEATGPGRSERAVLLVAAGLSGQARIDTLRHFMPDLEEDHARLVAEAMMYAAGLMDGAADPTAHEADGPGTGPNARAHERRILCTD